MKKYHFKSQDIFYDKEKSILSSNNKTHINDDKQNKYELDKFNYDILDQLLKGKNIKIETLSADDKKDNYFFLKDFLNLKTNHSFRSRQKLKFIKMCLIMTSKIQDYMDLLLQVMTKKTEIKKEYLLVVAKIRNAQLGVLPLKNNS